MTNQQTNPICDHMRYKGDFIGFNQREERELLALIVEALARLKDLSSNDQYIVKKAFQVFAKNQELKRDTFEKLMVILYMKLHLEPIEFHKDAKGGYFSGGWYFIPPNNQIEAAKKLKRRLKKRQEAIDAAWFDQFYESFDWESYVDKEAEKQTAKEALKEILGPDGIKEISDNRDPRNVIMFPDKKS